MPHFWTKNTEDEWAIFPLEDETISIAQHPPRTTKNPLAGARRTSRVLLLKQEPGSEAWILVAGAKRNVSTNGLPLSSGIRVLADRDEIRVDRVGTLFFSTERLAQVEELPGADRPIYCPRCKKEIEKGTPAVRCPSPNCRVWHHENPDRSWNCWTYADTCALCPQRTNQTEFQWTPEEL
jgi:hypothetical protein